MQQNPDLSQLIRLAQSPAGRQLLSYLQTNGGVDLQNAISFAASGNYAEAIQVLSSLLSNPDAQQLLKKLEDKP